MSRCIKVEKIASHFTTLVHKTMYMPTKFVTHGKLTKTYFIIMNSKILISVFAINVHFMSFIFILIGSER